MEFRKRLKPKKSLTNMDAAEKDVYLQYIEYNDTNAERVTPGIGMIEVKKKLADMFN